jgi:hypothetical protein
MRPAADSRAKRQPRHAKSARTVSRTRFDAMSFQRRKRSKSSVSSSRAASKICFSSTDGSSRSSGTAVGQSR